MAIVGATGAGKSSIARLIARAYGGYEGSIRLNGEEITSFDADRIGAMVSVVHQNVFLFHGTVEFNITLGRRDRAAAEGAARQVHADEFIRDLPGGYRFEVAHGGANLSAGQAQLISFARAVAADTDLVVLDEATSSVDSMTEALIERALARLYESRAVIAIAHRLSTMCSQLPPLECSSCAVRRPPFGSAPTSDRGPGRPAMRNGRWACRTGGSATATSRAGTRRWRPVPRAGRRVWRPRSPRVSRTWGAPPFW